jgi:uncharacterized damage-inducible protein DinB
MDTVSDIRRLLVRELDGFTREIARFPDDESVWLVAPGVTNAAGTLALHVSGNLRYFVGAVLGNSGYLRDRTAEFATRGTSRADIDAVLRAAIDEVSRALDGLDTVALDRPYPVAPAELVIRTGMFLLHLVAHTAFHLGQAGYIRRVVTGDARSAQPIPLDVLPDSPAL